MFDHQTIYILNQNRLSQNSLLYDIKKLTLLYVYQKN